MANVIRSDNEKKMVQLKNISTALNFPSPQQKPVAEVKSEDWTSLQGQFGWAEIANTAIPYLIRSGEKYISLRMADNRIFVRYKNVFTDEIRSCFRVKILHATSAEAQLLNEINFRHCDNFYGRLEFAVGDGIVSLKDITETYNFLNFCHLRLVERVSVPQNRCGFIKIATQNCVPYIWHEKKKFVPLFYFEGECKYLEEHSMALSGWDLAYLKLYCKIQGIRKTLYEGEAIRVVELELVKKFFPPDTAFEENWPEDYKIDGLVQKPVPKVVLSQVQTNTRQNIPKTNVNIQDDVKKKDASIPQREQLTVAPKTNPAVGATQNNSRSTPSLPSTTTNSLQVPPLIFHSNQPRPALKNTKPTAVGAPAPRTTVPPTPNSTNHQNTFPPGPPATILNNMARYRPFMAKPLTFPDTYQRGSRVLQIPEVTCNNAYFVVKTQVENKFFQCCVNLEPFLTTILLVSLEESASFFQMPLDLVMNAVNVMNLDIFLPNKMQKREFEKFKVYSTRGLLKLREFIDNLPQLRYILNKTKTFD
ncbi:uncharacterized protein LOC108907281 [Anoplophora glabripennis]|uniref:uncharacterized protein LOC108907281 n=1 Tax=Anoplophora glabripennis TaxID=217634 RepID=UPI0008756767|nr:uncharacterized protein LOC108907281 [Anoplophora glabripennis]XP_018566405.1 uncharacterized protein LOC108907281 [Anoplophora glabripennis]XP_018566406.1 uncharacterized protein LOC108907281 [Anoplophora glabripennis]